VAGKPQGAAQAAISGHTVECGRLLWVEAGDTITAPRHSRTERAMPGPSPPDSPSEVERRPEDRLDSWKEIGAYMKRDVTTVQRWEKREGMPVHRHVHDKMGSVYAFKADLDAWARLRSPVVVADSKVDPTSVAAAQVLPAAEPRRRRWFPWLMAAAGMVLGAGALWQFQKAEGSPQNPLAAARFLPLTDFDGIEQAATLSRDGRFVAFLSDRDGQMDVWVTQVGMGQFYNLTRGNVAGLFNPSVRTLSFSPDGTLVTFWARRPDQPDQSAISVWGVPVLGGQPRPYIEGAAEFDWSADGARLVYHTPGPGDPMYVRDAGQPANAKEIFSAPPGLHSHFVVWSPDQKFIYFVQGSVPDRMDIWRIRPTGGTPERITNHDSLVSHPVFLSERTLLYLASDPDGSGPWIHSTDVEQRAPRRVSSGINGYTSLAASADRRRLVATVASPKGTLWRLPIVDARAEMSAARRIPLTTANGFSPRLGPGYLLYVSPRGTGDGIWKLQADQATELWSAPDARIIGGPAIARDGRRIAFSVSQGGETLLYVANADGTNARVVTRAFELQGAPAWMPDGQAVVVAAVTNGVPRLFTVPLDSRPPSPLVEEYSAAPTWSPDGDFVAYSGPDIGTTFDVQAVKADGSAYNLPGKLTLTRGARHLSVMPGRRLVVLRGEIGHKNLWLIDLESGAERQLTDLPANFAVRDFDISADGRELVLEQVQEHSDIVLLEVPPQ
jgi:Tol biopolymer transport system component